MVVVVVEVVVVDFLAVVVVLVVLVVSTTVVFVVEVVDLVDSASAFDAQPLMAKDAPIASVRNRCRPTGGTALGCDGVGCGLVARTGRPDWLLSGRTLRSTSA
jgi:hypothetical protein